MSKLTDLITPNQKPISVFFCRLVILIRSTNIIISFLGTRLTGKTLTNMAKQSKLIYKLVKGYNDEFNGKVKRLLRAVFVKFSIFRIHRCKRNLEGRGFLLGRGGWARDVRPLKFEENKRRTSCLEGKINHVY